MLKITVVIPCFKVRSHILDVLSRIGPEVSRIYVVDDCCPENSGLHVQQNCRDERVVVIRSASNQGVGGAVLTGYSAAIADGADIIVKIDGDGQMDPRLLPRMVQPILKGHADYTKGNRFYDLTHIRRMPTIRLIGNAILSFMSKLSTGYWKVLDPNNGYTAIDARLIAHLPLERISKRYFFETDMLFRLNILRAVVMDIPMDAIYADEQSNLRFFTIISYVTLLWHRSNFLSDPPCCCSDWCSAALNGFYTMQPMNLRRSAQSCLRHYPCCPACNFFWPFFPMMYPQPRSIRSGNSWVS